MKNKKPESLLHEKFGFPEKYEDYTKEDAIKLTKLAIETKDAPFLHFILACQYSSNDQIEESLASLELALKQGYNDWDQIAEARSLYNARNTANFWNIISKYIPKGET